MFSRSSSRCLHRRGRDCLADRARRWCARVSGGSRLLDDDVVEAEQSQPPAVLCKGYRQEQGRWPWPRTCSANALPRPRSAASASPSRKPSPASRSVLRCRRLRRGQQPGARVQRAGTSEARGIPVIFTAVSRDGDHGYVFVQDKDGPCIALPVSGHAATTTAIPVRVRRRSPTFCRRSGPRGLCHGHAAHEWPRGLELPADQSELTAVADGSSLISRRDRIAGCVPA